MENGRFKYPHITYISSCLILLRQPNRGQYTQYIDTFFQTVQKFNKIQEYTEMQKCFLYVLVINKSPSIHTAVVY